MNLTKEKKEALLIIGLAIVLHSIAWSFIKETYGWKVNQSPEGIGLLISTFGLIAWVYGFIKYARAKGRSELLAIFLALFQLLGLLVLLLLSDVKKTKKS